MLLFIFDPFFSLSSLSKGYLCITIMFVHIFVILGVQLEVCRLHKACGSLQLPHLQLHSREGLGSAEPKQRGRGFPRVPPTAYDWCGVWPADCPEVDSPDLEKVGHPEQITLFE